MITLTDSAKNKIKEIVESEGLDHCSLRVKIMAGGCAGFSQDIQFDNLTKESDEVIEDDGVTLIVDPISLQYLTGVTIDYRKEGFSEGFKFLNPNTTGSCGCGKSVAF